MPRAPSYTPNQVGPVEQTGARLRAANNNGGVVGGVADGLRGAANATSEFAEAQDRLDAQNDDTQARALAAEAQLAYSTATTEFELKKAGAARGSQAEYAERIKALRDKTLARATTGRQRRMLEERLAGVHSAAIVSIGRHAVKEQMVERAGVLDAEIESTADWAASLSDPAQRDAAIAKVSGLAQQRVAEIDGYDPESSPEVFKLASLKATDVIHGKVLDRMLAVPDPDIEEVVGYVAAYSDEMLESTETAILARVQKPFQERMDRAGADLVMGELAGIAPAAIQGEPGASTPTAMALLRDFEGFREGTYWDVNHHRVGYGSDTITMASGQVRTVRKGDRVTRADAERDLARRTAALERTAAGKAGEGWNRLPEGARAAIVSVAYNYGEASDRLRPLWAAARAGDAGGVAEVISSFANDNDGVNRKRRMQEAAAALGEAGSGYANAPREWDRAAVEGRLNEIAEREKWTPERTQRVRQEVDRRIQRDEGLLKDQRADADDAAANIAAQRGDGFTSTNMIPREVWNKLSPVQQRSYEDTAKANREPKPVDANSDTAIALSVMRISDPEKFAGLNLAKYRPFLTPAELEQFAKDQATVSRGGAKVTEDRPKIDATIRRMKNWGGVDLGEDPVEALRVRRYMETQADEMRSKNKPVTRSDYDRWFTEATQAVKVKRSALGLDMLRGDATRRSSEYLSPNFRAVIRREFRQTFGREPNEAEMVEWFTRMEAGAR